MKRFKIGELAHRTGCLVETVRYYERIGLLPEPVRTENNHRAYNESHAERLLFIRHCRALDMSIDEIRELIEIRSQSETTCCGVDDLLDGHIRRVKERVAALQKLERQLLSLRSRCDNVQATQDCDIVQALSDFDQ